MIATPEWRNRLMQKLKAETCVRRKYGMRNERNGRTAIYKGEFCCGDSVPTPLGFFALEPSQFLIFNAGARLLRAPAWSGPGVGAQFASQQRLILRSGRKKCIYTNCCTQ